jgi:hypothetical protein
VQLCTDLHHPSGQKMPEDELEGPEV